MDGKKRGEHMGTANRVAVKKDIYKWAIEESQRDFEEIKDNFPRIEDWISGEAEPTFRQLENLAKFLRVALGYMFLDNPPETSVIESEFRTMDNKIPNISKNLQDTLFNMGRKQTWISEYRQDNGWDKVIPEEFENLNLKNKELFTEKAKEFIELDEYWYKEFKDTREAYNYLRSKLEAKGILVMQNGIVVTNTHRSLDIDEFRGFMLYDSVAPLIFINSKDSHAGKIFTLIHEYIHILIEEEGIFIEEDLQSKNAHEREINKVTAEFLMPKAHLLKEWSEDEQVIIQIEKFSKMFHVSKWALAIRLKELNLVTQAIVNEVKTIMQEDLENRSETAPSGGNYYTTYKSRYSESFVNTVIEGAESGDISYTYAFNLLDAKGKTYDRLKEEMTSYE